MDQCVLLIAEDPLVHDEVVKAAKAQGINCCRARTGADAVKCVTRSLPAVIFLDLQAESFKPLRVLQHLKRDARFADCGPVMGFVTHGAAEMSARAHELGCDFIYPRSTLVKQAASILRQLTAAAD